MAAVRAEGAEGAMSEPRPFHRLFELSFSDFFAGSDVSVEPEVDLSRKQQFLDLVLIRTGPGPLPRRLPDGFEDLAAHSLVTFKSHKEALDAWALYELIAHWVNYRKQCSPTMQELLPEGDFRLFAVCVRSPHNLAQQGELRPVRAGVYEVRWLTLCIRVIVVHELPQQEHNAMLHLFSAREELLRYAKEHYRPRSRETSTLLYELFKTYQEDPDMASQLEEFVRQSIDELLNKLPPEKRLEGLSPEELRKRLSPEQRLEGLSPEQRLEGLSPEELRAALEAAQRRLQANGPSKPQ
jgi:hypothetical protein